MTHVSRDITTKNPARIRQLLDELAGSPDPAAFTALLELQADLGLALAQSARTLAEASSWSSVADLAGTSRQAAWARWR
jgi:hypothetical protein